MPKLPYRLSLLLIPLSISIYYVLYGSSRSTSVSDTTPGGSGKMFDSIAPFYDLVNRFISLRNDEYWRSVMVSRSISALGPFDPNQSLNWIDVATGTADVLFEVQRAYHSLPSGNHTLVGVDPSDGMLEVANVKLQLSENSEVGHRRRNQQGNPVFFNTRFLKGEVEDSKIISALNELFQSHVDAVTVSFGVRNFKDIERGLDHILLKLSPSVVSVLEVSAPQFDSKDSMFTTLWKKSAIFTVSWIVPFIGRIAHFSRKLLSFFEDGSNDIGGDEYDYLVSSMLQFPSTRNFEKMFRTRGYTLFEPRKEWLGGMVKLWIFKIA